MIGLAQKIDALRFELVEIIHRFEITAYKSQVTEKLFLGGAFFFFMICGTSHEFQKREHLLH